MAQPIQAESRAHVARSDEPRIFAWFDRSRADRLEALGRGVLRYGLVAMLGLWGAAKFSDFEAQAIRPLVEHHPVLSVLYTWFGIRGGSAVIGVVEVTAAALMAARRFSPHLSAAGSLLATLTFATTLSFLITTPKIFAPDNPFGGFIMKDLILLGAAVHTASEALHAALKRRAA